MSPAPSPEQPILILGGHLREMVDGVRYYTNIHRDECHGLRTAGALAASGGRILLLSNVAHPATKGVEQVTLPANTGAAGLLKAAGDLLRQHGVAAVLQLSSIASLKAAHISPTKLKLKTAEGSRIPMEVAGNIDAAAHLRRAGLPAIAGYDQYQQWFSHGDEALCRRLQHTAETTLPPPPHGTAPAPATTAEGKLSGRHIIVTSGPTMETLTASGDAITNISSGAQGYAIAQALAEIGAHVTLISGPTRLLAPSHARITTLYVVSAQAMYDAVLSHLPADVYIGVAAVADFSLATPAPLMLAPEQAHTLMLSQNPDILYSVSHHAKRPKLVIGFAAETHDLLAYAKGKLASKGADVICANPVDAASRRQLGDGGNQVTWVARDHIDPWPVTNKRDIARRMGISIAALLA